MYVHMKFKCIFLCKSSDFVKNTFTFFELVGFCYLYISARYADAFVLESKRNASLKITLAFAAAKLRPERLVFSDQLKFIKERAKKSSYEGIEKIQEAIRTAGERLRANVNFDLTLELMFLTIKEN